MTPVLHPACTCTTTRHDPDCTTPHLPNADSLDIRDSGPPVRVIWRTGRKVGRTIYEVHPDGTERLIGVMDTPELAHTAVTAVNNHHAEQP